MGSIIVKALPATLDAMTNDETNHQEEQEQESPESPAPVTEETVKAWVKEALSDFLPGQGEQQSAVVESEDETDEPVTIKAMEAAARKAVEEAMEPLKASLSKPKKATPKKPTPRKVQEEEEPVPVSGMNKLRTFLWGDE